MPQDAMKIKEKIISFIRARGPSLPVHIARETGLSILFASAFLSELVAEKEIKFSDMKVGSSPVYFIPDQFPKLERFTEHLKSKEKDAYLLLKEKKFLEDLNQEPAIRIALRAIKDFAIPFEHDGKLVWRYFTISQEEYQAPVQKIESVTVEIVEEILPAPQIEEASQKEINEPEEIVSPKDSLNIFDKKEKPKKAVPKEKHAKAPSKKPAAKKKPTSQAKQDNFFNSIKDHLTKKGIEITDIIGFSKSDLTLKINENKNEKILIAFNKKKITEADIIKAHKSAKEFKLPYKILSLGEPNKKTTSLIEAIKKLDKLESVG